jgi:hypothetical protein
MKYQGSCHCQAVKFEVEDIDLEKVITCNCSYCGRQGFILGFVPADQFTLLTPDAPLTEYRFNTQKISHQFCPTCGVQGFGSGTNKDGSAVRMINVRCLESVDIASLNPTPVNGKDF